MTFGVDTDGNYGYIKAGADTVIPFKHGSGKYYAHCVALSDTKGNGYVQIYRNEESIFSVSKGTKDFTIKILKNIQCTASFIYFVGGLSPSYAIYKNGVIIDNPSSITELSANDTIKCVVNAAVGGVSMLSAFIIC